MRAWNAKALAIVVLSVVSGMSFALGLMVGRATTGESRRAVAYAPGGAYNSSSVAASTAPEIMPEKQTPPTEITIVTDVTEEKKKTAKIEPPAQTVRPAPKAPPQAVSSVKVFYVQAGAFSDRKAAETMRIRLKAMGYESYIKSPDKTGAGRSYKVRVGKFARRQDAEMLALKLKREAVTEAFVSDSD